MALKRSIMTWRARKTLAIPPVPRRAISRYRWAMSRPSSGSFIGASVASVEPVREAEARVDREAAHGRAEPRGALPARRHLAEVPELVNERLEARVLEERREIFADAPQ